MTRDTKTVRALRLAVLGSLVSVGFAFFAGALRGQHDADRPNIVLIYADDLGFGDVGCYGATGIETPNIDALAKRGLRLTDGHAAAATCTPSRYSLLTGQYAFRRKDARILPGSAPLIIPTDVQTLPKLLQNAGYETAVVGKWHLGLGDGQVDWNADVKPGPLEVGFDFSYLMPATGDRVPCVYLENHHVVGLDPNDPIRISYGDPILEEPTGKEHPELLKQIPSHGHDQTIINGISRIGYMRGGRTARWVDEDMADVFVTEAKNWLAMREPSKPFFLFFSTHDIHVPRVPHARFVGSSKSGLRGDAAQQLDWCVGEIVATLQRMGVSDNTLIVFTSDNGPVVDDGYHDGAVENLSSHGPAGRWRGGKYSNFEAGTRVPWIMTWPARIAADTVSNALVSQVDLLRSVAAITGQAVKNDEPLDSVDVHAALLGESDFGRAELIVQASANSLRQGPWKLIPARKGPAVNKNVNIELGNFAEDQLFNLESDPGEQTNVAAQHEARVQAMKRRLAELER